ncbi:MAG TPA: carboxymuconolactone decarboxylase family protein [Burkholderiales bacterium]|nr:carboxymuconolactone decarboxylase family protein [Burkholderiales bacterium]
MSDSNVTRVRLLEKGQADASLGPLYDRADAVSQGSTLPGPTLFGNQVRALAHNPALLQALFKVYEAFAAEPSIDRKLTELGILVVSRVNACRYCVQHHAPLAHGAGLKTAQLEAIQNDAWSDRRLWSDEEWLVVRYAEALASVPQRVDDTLFAELKAHFSERQIVDLTMRLALCAAWNKFNDALGLDTETAFQHAFAELGIAAGAENASA